MAKVPNAIEILPKIWTAWVGRSSVTDRRQMDGQQYIANANVSSRSANKMLTACLGQMITEQARYNIDLFKKADLLKLLCLLDATMT